MTRSALNVALTTVTQPKSATVYSLIKLIIFDYVEKMADNFWMETGKYFFTSYRRKNVERSFFKPKYVIYQKMVAKGGKVRKGAEYAQSVMEVVLDEKNVNYINETA